MGEDVPSFFDEEAKWIEVAVIVTDLIVPYGQIIVFLLPLLVVYIWYRKVTWKTALIAVAIGALLAWGLYEFDEWLFNWGAAETFKAIHGPDGI